MSDRRSLHAGHEWKEVWPCVGTNPPVALPAHLATPAPAELLVPAACPVVTIGVGFEKVLVAAPFGCPVAAGTVPSFLT
jgi:hypothetical protein